MKNVIFIMVLFVMGIGEATAREVVVYTSVDQVFSQPILEKFEQQTRIKLKALYDVEAAKTVGLVNRLFAERKRPKADVFWNSEVSRTVKLMEQGILEPYKSVYWEKFPALFKDKNYYWTGFGARARVLIYNVNMLSPDQVPASILDLTRPEWKKKVTMAYPLFGTTSMHVAALYAILGPEKTESYLQGLVDNDILVVDGNSVTRDLVAEGKIPMGFTDTDDANVAVQDGRPVKTVYPDQGGMGVLLIPNTVALIKGGPNPENGRQLIDYLLSEEVESILAFGPSAQMPLRSNVKKPDTMVDYQDITAMEIDYHHLSKYVQRASDFCRKLFVR